MNRVDIIESLERRILFNALAFSKPTSFPTGTNPSDIVAADLTGNGIVDLVTSDFGSASVSVLMGNGNGTFQPPVSYPVGNSPESLAIGDLNGDGIPDIVTANEADNTISVLMGLGNGTFAPQVTYQVGIHPEAVAIGDLNGDGSNDVVTANEGSNTISVLLNAGNGTLEPPSNYLAAAQPDSLALADLNADGRPDVVVGSPAYNDVHVLLNNGFGAYPTNTAYAAGAVPRAVAVADMTSNGLPDIITANSSGQNLSLLDGNANGTFQAQSIHGAGNRPMSLAIADMNGDGKPDIVTANLNDDQVAILRRTGLSTFDVSVAFNVGDSPTSVAVADFNGDGRPDIVTADFATNSVTVLLNQTVFVPLIPTSSTISVSQNPVLSGNHLVVRVQVRATEATRDHLAGVVDFFDNLAVIGVQHVTSDGVALISTKNLSPGVSLISAQYLSDGTFAASTSNTISEMAEASPQATVLVQPSIIAVHLPADYVPGTRGTADVAIYDAGTGPVTASVRVSLFASTSTTFSAAAFPLTLQGSDVVNIKLAGNQSQIAPLNFFVPADIEPGNYTIFAALAPVSGISAAQVSAVPAVGITTQQAVLQFGDVSTQHGYRLTRTLPDGDVYTLEMTGRGTGNVTEDATGGISIYLTGTNGGSTVKIISSTGVTLDGLDQNSLIEAFDAPTTNLDGDVSLQYGVRDLTLANASNCQLALGGSVPNALSFANLSDVTISTGVPIHSLSVDSYTNQPGDMITAPWIVGLNCAGDFGATVIIDGGTGALDRGLQTANIGGTVEDSVWRILSSVGSVNVGGIAAGWSGSVRGTIDSFIDTGSFAGQLAAHNIGILQIDGNLTDADILTGADFGNDGRIGGGDDTFASGSLTSLKVDGSVTNSLVAAGFKPADDTLVLSGATLLSRSSIRAITVGGTVDSASRFLAVALPKLVSIDGMELATDGDLNFVI